MAEGVRGEIELYIQNSDLRNTDININYGSFMFILLMLPKSFLKENGFI